MISTLISFIIVGFVSGNTILVLPLYFSRSGDYKRLIILNELLSIVGLSYFLFFIVMDFGGISRLAYSLKNPMPNSILGTELSLVILSLLFHVVFCMQFLSKIYLHKKRIQAIAIVTILSSVSCVFFFLRFQALFVGNSALSSIIGSLCFLFFFLTVGQLILFLLCKTINILNSTQYTLASIHKVKNYAFYFGGLFSMSIILFKVMA